MSELSKPEEDLQDPGEAQGPVEVQLLEAEVGEAASLSASSPTVSSSAPGEALPQEALKEMITNLMNFLLLKYQAKEWTSQAEMLEKVLKDNQEHFRVVFRQASECLQLVFGVEVTVVYPRADTYAMIPALGLTCDAMQSGEQGLPKAGLLVLVLSVIMRNGDPTPEEVVWGALSRMGVCVGREHSIFGEPKELLTQVWVQEGYLEYRQVPDSDPARYKFLWGPRAYAETSKQKVMAFVLRVRQRAWRSFVLQFAEAAREEKGQGGLSQSSSQSNPSLCD
ncbi:melanoma-associated antigen 10-like isoform X1 [Cervus canadensis]|uniref:melanoma-associated antigen 10-like isoform X1 n=1 Tax=Cervus canadensis TaxID=1574408 RepID=UPI001CA34268|nr:melanoma-associated antigen 10-like isoform X1 [Cervus canadensis]XP_043315869.1 melanoma-associated antigen 10-like isoform X1 [Cervus canadensis]